MEKIRTAFNAGVFVLSSIAEIAALESRVDAQRMVTLDGGQIALWHAER